MVGGNLVGVLAFMLAYIRKELNGGLQQTHTPPGAIYEAILGRC